MSRNQKISNFLKISEGIYPVQESKNDWCQLLFCSVSKTFDCYTHVCSWYKHCYKSCKIFSCHIFFLDESSNTLNLLLFHYIFYISKSILYLNNLVFYKICMFIYKNDLWNDRNLIYSSRKNAICLKMLARITVHCNDFLCTICK